MIRIAIRWLIPFVLIAATYNPTQYNWVRWSLTNLSKQLPLIVLSGLILLIVYIIFMRTTLRSIGTFSMALVLALVAALLWVLYDFGWLSLENLAANLWLGIVALSLVLSISLSWSHIRRATAGQADMDDVDE
ncbi:DUF6524 family protein [Planktotalea sp.]|uniref:DUF6524 family protein n=1 Tax=Planktotalea sp. TaxID=2029877 RepID=UPI0025F9A43B|nr:DUF6524 family protein [Planktotalea sp.]